jgi:hypothetical protein
VTIKPLLKSQVPPLAFEEACRGGMQMYIALQPMVSLIAGILILIIPRLLNYIVAIYLIVIGILGLAKM